MKHPLMPEIRDANCLSFAVSIHLVGAAGWWVASHIRFTFSVRIKSIEMMNLNLWDFVSFRFFLLL
jgi:hypothetical protein